MTRTLAFIASLLTTCVVAAYAIDLFYGSPLRAADQQIASLADRAAALDAREASARIALANIAATPDVSDALFEGGSIEDASARLQEAIRNAVAGAGGIPTSSQSVVTNLDEGHAKLAVLLHARFDEHGLLAFLRAIESEQPLALVETLDVRLMPVAGADQALDVTATITKFHAGLTQN